MDLELHINDLKTWNEDNNSQYSISFDNGIFIVIFNSKKLLLKQTNNGFEYKIDDESWIEKICNSSPFNFVKTVNSILLNI